MKNIFYFVKWLHDKGGETWHYIILFLDHLMPGGLRLPDKTILEYGPDHSIVSMIQYRNSK